MTPEERMKKIKILFLQMDLGQTFEEKIIAKECLMNHFSDLFDQVKRLTEALEKIKEKNYSDFPLETLKEELNVRAARTFDIARKALEVK